jgi:Spy/CpxP family protein refolding chaperone
MENTQPKPKPPRKAKSPWLLALAVTGAVFLFGVVVGAVLMQAFMVRGSMKKFGSPGFRTEGAVKHIKKDLDLSDEQEIQLQKLFEEHARNMKAIHKDVRPRVEAELESFRSKVEAILTTEQAKRWNEKFKKRMNEMLPSFPPGPGGMKGPPHAGKKDMPAPPPH